MNIRDKLREFSIYVPEAAHRYRAGKGCLVWLAAEGAEGEQDLFLMPVTRDQYEAMLIAGLIGGGSWHVDQMYLHPAAPPLAVAAQAH